MPSRLVVSFIFTLAWLSVAAEGRGQAGLTLDQYLRESGFRPHGPEPEWMQGKLGALIRQAVGDWEKKQYDRVILSLTAALQLNPDTTIKAAIYDLRGQAYAEKNELKKSLADANEAIRLDPRLAMAYNTRGVAYGRMGDLTQAIKDYEMAVRLDRNLAVAKQNLAAARGMKKR